MIFLLDFLFAFGIMLSCICIFLSYFHVVCLFLFGYLVFILFVFQNKKRKIRKNYKNSVCVCVSTCVPLMAIKTKFLNFVSFVA